jgi:hypothetical protein
MSAERIRKVPELMEGLANAASIQQRELDCGLFHTFDGDERPGYVASLASVTEHDGALYGLCFSDDGPDDGPHPIVRGVHVALASCRSTASRSRDVGIIVIDVWGHANRAAANAHVDICCGERRD